MKPWIDLLARMPSLVSFSKIAARCPGAESMLSECVPYAVFQPKQCLLSGCIVGVEVLARLWHARWGEIPPSEFLKQWSDAGKMGSLSVQMLEAGAAAHHFWLNRGRRIHVSVNVPASVMACEDIVDRLIDVARQRGVPASNFTLELTEEERVNEPIIFRRLAARVRDAGFGLALDDFGTGYNSLKTLMSGPFSELKIDRSFVRRVAQRSDRRVALESCVLLGKRLGLLVTAEGVESAEDLGAVRAAGCDIAQGYFVSAPVDANGVISLARQCGRD